MPENSVTASVAPTLPNAVCCIGAGSIGAGWAAHFLRAGLAVTVYDADPGREAYLRETIDIAWPTLTQLGLAASASRENLVFTSDIDAAVRNAQFVQESVYEDLDLKRRVLAEFDARLPQDVVIASSSSGFLASHLREACRSCPGRVIVGHPFNPVYLVPLVEIVGGPGCSQAALRTAELFYGSTGQQPVTLRNEINAYIGNRLQYALWKEVLYLLSQDIASLADIDRALTYGPATRWAVMGASAAWFLTARDAEGYPAFVIDELWRELLAGYCAPPSFMPDRKLMDRYIDDMKAYMKGQNFIALREARDRAVTAVLSRFRTDESSGAPIVREPK